MADKILKPGFPKWCLIAQLSYLQKNNFFKIAIKYKGWVFDSTSEK